MAIVQKTNKLGNVTITFNYDDEAMNLRGIEIQNATVGEVLFNIFGSQAGTHVGPPFQNVSITFPPPKRPPFLVLIAPKNGAEYFGGFEWKCEVDY